MESDFASYSLARLLILALLPVAGILLADPGESQVNATPDEISRAASVLSDWNGENDEGEKRVLHLVYWTPSDREPVPEYRERLSGIMLNIQKFYADEMERLGLGRRSFNLKLEEDNHLQVHLVKGAGPTVDYDVQSGREIREECLPLLKESGIDPKNETIMIFCNLATWDETKKIFRHKSPYYASGGPRNGTAWQLDTPTIAIERIVLTEPIINDGQYGDISMGKHNSIFIGGIAHELGHGLGLPHCRETNREKQNVGTALMGAGNRTYGNELRNEGRGTFLTLAHALRLASHPQFSGSTKGLNLPVETAIDDLVLTVEGKRIDVSGRVSSDIPVYALVAYFDPEGGSDYDALTATAIPDESGHFRLRSPELPPGKRGEFRLFPLLANGMIAKGGMSRTPFRYPYQVSSDGIPDLTQYQHRKVIQPLLDALRNREKEEVARLAAQLATSESAFIRHIVENVTGTGKPSAASPALIDSTVDWISLSDCATQKHSVGWAKPFFNRLPEPQLVIESGGELFSHGVYAHAPASHVWNLDEKWDSLSGEAGLADGNRGSVVFSLFVDGKKKWNSRLIKTGERARYQVDLSGASELELRVENGGDGNAGDWGLWLNPVLKRN